MLRTVIASAAVVAVFGGIGISVVDTRSTGPGEDRLVELLDPTYWTRSLCGENGATRGLFFRPEFRIALAGSAAAAEDAPDEVPLWPNLGDYTYPITTDYEITQAYFDQGIRLTFAFNHWEAIRAFKQAQRLDPGCAMCYWAEGLAHGPNINAAMEASAVEPAFAATSKAMALAEGASAKERTLITALSKRYSPDPDADRAALDDAFAAAMAEVHAAYPDDQLIATLYAESVMDTTPWDYWERDFRTPKPAVAKAIAAVEGVLAANPSHPGAIHLYIHLTEASRSPELAEPYADRLAAQMPAAGHLVHMPGHTFFRVGRYIDSLNTNVKAVAADEAYLNQVEGSAIYRYGYYPHNVHFVLVSAQMAGDAKTALEFADKLDALIPIEVTVQQTWMQPIKAAPYFAKLQFGKRDDVLSLADPGEDFPFIRGIWHYARGASLAQSGGTRAAAAEAKAIAKLRRSENMKVFNEGLVPGDDILALAQKMVEARIAQAEGRYKKAAKLLKAAAILQDSLSYTEPPYWYYPVRQTLGAVYLQAGDHEKAEKAFLDSLAKHPNNAWSLYGLMKAQEAAGDPAAATTAEAYKKASISKEDVAIGRL